MNETTDLAEMTRRVAQREELLGRLRKILIEHLQLRR